MDLPSEGKIYFNGRGVVGDFASYCTYHIHIVEAFAHVKLNLSFTHQYHIFLAHKIRHATIN